jgi:hypothetical protein
LEAEVDEQAGRNENEPHLMILDHAKPETSRAALRLAEAAGKRLDNSHLLLPAPPI